MQTDILHDGISVVIPVYNSADILDDLAARLADVLPGLSPQFELILVNDDSRDQSWEKVCALTEKYSWVRGFSLMRSQAAWFSRKVISSLAPLA